MTRIPREPIATLVGMACLAAAMLAPQPAAAHAVGVSRGTWVISGNSLSASLAFANAEGATLADVLPAALEADPAAARPALSAAIATGIMVSRGGIPCTGGVVAVAVAPPDGLAIDALWNCPDEREGMREGMRVELPMLGSLQPGHRHLALLGTSGADLVVVHSRASVLEIHAPADQAPTRRGAARSLAWLGLTHVLGGWDHVLFLVGLVLGLRRLKPLVAAVTAFTVGHSASLAISVLGGWSPSPRIVEPLIALSLAWVGVEALRNVDTSRRWLLTLAFGFVHGFGFAGALLEIAMPRAELPIALLAFNCGVELAQLLAILALVPALAWLASRNGIRRRAAGALAWGVIGCGIAAFMLRIGG